MRKQDDIKLVWFIDHPSARIWSVNPYRRCGIGCVYCIAHTKGTAVPWYGPDRIINELRPRLEAVPPGFEVSVGALVDAYPREEAALGITRMILREISRQKRPFCINTKSDLVQRDTDILLRHEGHCDVYLSLCTLDEKIIAELEINAPSAADRLRAVAVMKHAGVDINIDASPWIPGVSDIKTLLEILPAGVGVQTAPLEIRHLGTAATIAGLKFTQEQIDTAYLRHRDAVGRRDRVRWGAPANRANETNASDSDQV